MDFAQSRVDPKLSEYGYINESHEFAEAAEETSNIQPLTKLSV